ncbi:hypothetical protein [Halosegnis marinus]|uniref:Uncharacterized protein n=1 Tax=Halosegnis marinus TaxID=3034023 RepID=A0ABD5ZLM6_9EURY|nr:hypothetical protein [Halosegnis sp. DT85]
MDRVQGLVLGAHLLIAVVLVGFAVGNFVGTGDPVAALPPLVVAVLVVGLGRSVARVVGRRD